MMKAMRIRYVVSNVRQQGLGQSGMIEKPGPLPPGMSILPSISLDTPPPPPLPSLEPKALPQPMPETRVPNPGAPSEMIQPGKYPVVNTYPVPPEPPPGSQPRWVNEGKNDLTRTLLATGTVAAIAAASFAFFR